MTDEELREIAKKFLNKNIPHVLLVQTDNGVTLSSIATAEDMFDFLQVLVDANPVILDIMQDVIDSREESPKEENVYLN